RFSGFCFHSSGKPLLWRGFPRRCRQAPRHHRGGQQSNVLCGPPEKPSPKFPRQTVTVTFYFKPDATLTVGDNPAGLADLTSGASIKGRCARGTRQVVAAKVYVEPPAAANQKPGQQPKVAELNLARMEIGDTGRLPGTVRVKQVLSDKEILATVTYTYTTR